jgi:type II secretory pathway pseudopilin PulG
MSTFFKVLMIILIILVIALVVLYFVGRRMQKKQAAQQEQMEAAKQTVSMLVIDKKRLPIKDSGLPQMVIDQTPKLMRRSKLPIVKAKVNVNAKGRNAVGGSRIMTLVSDAAIFDTIPVKKEVKAVISGIYITEVKGVRGPLETPPKKQSFWQRTKAKFSRKSK